MTLFIISIPLMLVAVGVAVVPLLAMSHREVRHVAEEFEHRREQHRLAHQAHHHAHATRPTAATGPSSTHRPAGPRGWVGMSRHSCREAEPPRNRCPREWILSD